MTTPAMVADAPLLEVQELSVRFGVVAALSGVTYGLYGDEIVGLIGPNGAGKTTFIDAITGFVPSTGSVKLKGEEIARQPPHLRARHGLTRTFQSMELFQDLTVRQNLMVSAENAASVAPLRARKATQRDLVDRGLSSMGLTEAADSLPGSLSLGSQKLVSVARALASDASVLLLDEPAAGLDSDESQEFAERLRSGLHPGVAVLMIDHDLELVMGACHRILVLSFGRIIAQGTPTEIGQDSVVREAYLGDEEVD